MKNKIQKLVQKTIQLLVVVLLCYLPFISVAQWSTNPYGNTIVCVEAGAQGGTVMTTDGAGGTIIAWNDSRNDTGDIYAQRIDGNGIVQWAPNGISISSAATLQSLLTLSSITSDGSGGAIITWVDFRDITDPNNPNVDVNIYAQRVNGDGVVQWATNGIPICKAQGEQTAPIIVSDGSGGAIIAWTDIRSLQPLNQDIYAIGIKADGTIKWPEVAVTATIKNQVSPVIVSDNNGGAILTWVDWRNSDNGLNANDIYAQRISSSGSPVWTADGVGICVTDRFQTSPRIASDGANGAIISWLDDRSIVVNTSNVDLFAQRINGSGAVQWTTNGVGISTTSEKQVSHSIASDQAGGAVLAWETWTGSVSRLNVQRVSASGNSLWMTNGIPIGSGGKRVPVVAFDNDNTFLVWEDDRNSGNDLYAQKLDGSGSEQWLFGGVVISNAYGSQVAPRLVFDAQGGAIISWSDSRNILSDVFAQRIQSGGALGGSSVIGSQTITFNSIPEKKFSDKSFTLNAIASSNLPVTYTSSNLSVTTIEGSNVTIIGVGTSTITANQTGNASYTAAPPVSQQLTVTKGDQTISFDALPTKAPGDPEFTLSANASSDLVVSYASSNTAVATVSGSTVTIVGMGTTNITASQAGNVNYNAAASVVQPLVVKATQSITFTSIPNKTLGDPAFAVSATSSASLLVHFTAATDKISISGNQVTLLKAGSVTINANQAGNANVSAAPQVSQTFCINPAKPSITVTGTNTPAPVLTSSAASGNQWYKNGLIISGATNTTYTVTSEGSYTVVDSQDNCASLPSDEETFVIITGIEHAGAGIKVYPNPMENDLVVDISEWNSTTPVALTLFDAVGNPVHKTTGNGIATIPVGSLAAGVYLLKIQSGKQFIIKKLKK